jgi:hypothetical protein
MLQAPTAVNSSSSPPTTCILARKRSCDSLLYWLHFAAVCSVVAAATVAVAVAFAVAFAVAVAVAVADIAVAVRLLLCVVAVAAAADAVAAADAAGLSPLLLLRPAASPHCCCTNSFLH